MRLRAPGAGDAAAAVVAEGPCFRLLHAPAAARAVLLAQLPASLDAASLHVRAGPGGVAVSYRFGGGGGEGGGGAAGGGCVDAEIVCALPPELRAVAAGGGSGPRCLLFSGARVAVVCECRA